MGMCSSLEEAPLGRVNRASGRWLHPQYAVWKKRVQEEGDKNSEAPISVRKSGLLIPSPVQCVHWRWKSIKDTKLNCNNYDFIG
jgi:hypothetical protein